MVFGLRKLFGIGAGGDLSISPEDAQALIAGSDALVIDVREPAEVARSGKVAGARNIPLGDLERHASPHSEHHDGAFEPNRPIVCYCASGMRSANAAEILSHLGYTRAYNLGGFSAWVAAGGATERG